MAHPYHHALSSVKKWGGTVDDYMAIHAWFDAQKPILQTFGTGPCVTMRRESGSPRRSSARRSPSRPGAIIPTRWVGEQHVREDLGFIPSFADWVKAIRPEPWMGRPSGSRRWSIRISPRPWSRSADMTDPAYLRLGLPPDGVALHCPARGGPGASPRHARRSRLPDGAQALLPADALRACRATGGGRHADRLIAPNHPFIPIQRPASWPGLLHSGGPHGGLLHPFLMPARRRHARQGCPRARAVSELCARGSGRRRPGGRGLRPRAPGRARGQHPLDP